MRSALINTGCNDRVLFVEDTSEAFWCCHGDNGFSVLVKGSLVLCQGLAGPWYARREREAVKAKVQWFRGLVDQMRAQAQTRQKTRGNSGLQE